VAPKATKQARANQFVGLTAATSLLQPVGDRVRLLLLAAPKPKQ
jgi:hypothetical protein